MSAPDRRLFVALRVPADLQALVLPDRRLVPGDWKWVSSAKLHVTLQFLGNVPAAALDPLAAALAPLAIRPSLPIVAEQLMGFPQDAAARVLTRRVTLTPALADLQAEVRDRVGPWIASQYQSESYRPHLTLARCRRGLPVPDLILPPLDWDAREVFLLESVRNSDGVAYVDRVRIGWGTTACG